MSQQRAVGRLRVAFETELERAKRGLNETRDELRSTKGEAEKTEGRFGRLSQAGRRLGQSLQRHVYRWARRAAAALLALGAASVKMAADFHHAMAEVDTLLQLPEESLAKLSRTMLDLTTQIPMSAREMTAGLYQAVSAGFEDAAGIVEDSARAAVGGVATVTEAVELASAVTKAYGDTSREAAQGVFDLAFQTVRLGQTTFPELARSIMRVTATSNELGISQEQLFAVFATATGVTGNAAEVSTQLSAIYTGLTSDSDELRSILREQGYETIQAALASRGLLGVLEMVRDVTGDNIGQFQTLVGGARGVRLALALTGSQADAYNDRLEAMEDAAGSADAAFERMAQTLSSRFRLALNRGSKLLVEIGTIAAPEVESALDGVGHQLDRLSDWISDNEGQIRAFIRDLGEIAEGLGAIAVQAGRATGGIVRLLANSRRGWQQEFWGRIRGTRDFQAWQREFSDMELEEVEAKLELYRDRLAELDGEALEDFRRRTRDWHLAAVERFEQLAGPVRVDPPTRRDDPDPTSDPDSPSDPTSPTGLPQVSAEAARARERLAELEAQLRTLRQLGVQGLLEHAPDELQAAAQEVLALDRAIEQLQVTFAESDTSVSEVLAAHLGLLEDAREEAFERASDLAARQGELVDQETQRARQQLEELTRDLELLQSAGAEALSDLPPAVASAIQEVGQLDQAIRDLEETVQSANQEIGELVENELARMRERRAELTRLVGQSGHLQRLLDVLPSIGETLMDQLDPGDIQAVAQELDAFAEGIQRVEQARLELQLARFSDDSERLEEATQALEAAQADLAREVGRVEQALRRMGLPARVIDRILAQVAQSASQAGAELAETASWFDRLAEHASTLEGLARGVMSVADAMGILENDTRQALDGVINLAGGIGRIAGGDIIGGGVQAVGGLVNLVSGLFGGKDDHAVRENTQALEMLTQGISSLGAQVGTFQGRMFHEISEAAAIARDTRVSQGIRGSFSSSTRRNRRLRHFEAELARLGITMDEAAAIARDMGITLDGTKDSFDMLIEALEHHALGAWLGQVQTQLGLLRAEFQLFDIDDPAEQLRRFRDVLLEFMDLDPSTMAELSGLDLGTAEGRAQFEAWLQEMFTRISEGDQSVLRELDRIGPDQFIQLAQEMMRLSGSEDPGGASSVHRVDSITAIQANKLLAYNSSQLHVQRSILATLRGFGGSVPVPDVGGSTDTPRGSRMVGGVSVHVDAVFHTRGELTREAVQEASDQLGDGILKRVKEELRNEALNRGASPGSRERLEVTI